MNDIKNDINLREAVSRREQKLPPMSADLNERVLQGNPGLKAIQIRYSLIKAST